jgi:membrane associated rhomboid family serine protease
MAEPSLSGGTTSCIVTVVAGPQVAFPVPSHAERRVTVIMGRMLTQGPALVAIGMWFVFQIISAIGVLGGGSQMGGVAYGAHFGGFIAGLALVKAFAIGRDTNRGVGRGRWQ